MKRGVHHGIRIKNAESLKERITNSVILLVTVSMLLLGVVSCGLNFYSAYSTLKQSMNSMSSVVAERVECEVRAYMNIVQNMGTSYQLGSADVSVEEKQAYIDQMVEHYGLIRGKLIGLDGIAQIDGTDYNDREYFQAALTGKASFTEPLFAKTDGSISLIVAAPVWKDGKLDSEVTGVVFIVLPTNTLNDIAASVELSKNCGTYILNRKGTVVAHTTTEMVESQHNTIEQSKAEPELEALAGLEKRMIAGEDGFGIYYYQKSIKFLSYSPIPSTDGWSVGVEAPIMDYLMDTLVGIIITVAIVIAAIVAGGFIARKLGISIGNPIEQCTERIKLLVKGDLHTEVQVFDAKDEVGELGRATKLLVEGFNRMIEDLKYLLAKLAEGDFTAKSKAMDSYAGDFEAIVLSLRSTVENLDVTMKQINEGAEQVALGSSQMAESAQSLAEGATEQAGAVEELTATVENVNQVARDSAVTAEQAAASTSQAALEAEEGKKSIQTLVVAMENITNVSLEIQNIIGAIEDIASQTNLLSLNASIEAARAGEAGKGFAVVADQIGKLAADSARSAVETRDLINKSIEEIKRGNSITQETALALEGIIKGMHGIADMAKGASGASNAQAEMIQQIQEGIEQIAGVVQSNSAAAQESSATSGELSAQSENLKSLVDQFHLKE